MSKVYHIFFLLLGVSHFLYAQTLKDVTFEKISIEDGLSQNSVMSILQDNQGFMWMGTQDGLNRYDGYSFKIYKHTTQDSLSISSSWIHAIQEDVYGNLWVGTYNGLNKYVRDKDYFMRYTFHRTNDVEHTQINTLFRDAEQNIWIGSQEGLSVVSFENGKEKFYHFSEHNTPLKDKIITSIAQDKHHDIWVGTFQDGIFKISQRGREYIVEPVFLENAPHEESKVVGKISTLYINMHTDDVWISSEKGLIYMNPDRHKYFLYTEEQGISFEHGSVVSIYSDSHQNVWIATQTNGLFVLDANEHRFRYFSHSDYDVESISDNSLTTAIWEDRTGIIWIGSLIGGVNKYVPNKHKFRVYKRKLTSDQSLAEGSVRSFWTDSHKRVWIGLQNKGINLYDPKNNTWRFYGIEKGIPANIKGIYLDEKNNELWVASRYAGVIKAKLDNQLNITKITNYKEKPEGKERKTWENSISNLFVDKQQQIWVYGFEGSLCLYNRERDEFEMTLHKTVKNNKSGNTVFVEDNNNFWLGNSLGIHLYNPETRAFITHFRTKSEDGIIPDASIKSLEKSKKGFLWIGSTKGLIRLNPQTNELKIYTMDNGLPNEVVYAALEDKNGNIWGSTNKGIFCLNPNTNEIKCYDASDGLQSNEFNTGAYYKSPEYELFFGGVNGYNAFFPEEIISHSVAPEVMVTEFQIFNTPVRVSPHKEENTIIQSVIHMADKIFLSYQDYVFSFSFSALHYAAPQKNQYAFMLDGFEKEWNIRSWDRRFATYTNIPAGEYTLKVKASNNEGVWSKIKEIKIYIKPPIWEENWFQVLVGVLVLFLVYSFYRFRLNAIQRQNQKLEDMVRLRTQEIEKQNKMLEIQKQEILSKNKELEQQQEEISSQKDYISLKNQELQTQNAEIERSYWNMSVISEVGQQITSTLDIEKVTETIYKKIKGLINVAEFGLAYYDADARMIEYVLYIFKEKRIDNIRFSVEEQKFASWCVRNKQPIFSNNLMEDYRKYVTHLRHYEGQDLEASMMCLPLMIEDRIIGLLKVQSSVPYSYSGYDFSIIQAMASYIAIALDNTKAYLRLKEAHHKITDSIRYAQTIQEAFLPTLQTISESVREFFIFYKAKDIVSGDFYWFYHTENKTFAAVADCTGHGVPGALMAMVGTNILNDIVKTNRIYNPALILEHLNKQIIELLHQTESQNSDGLDIALCLIEKQDNEEVDVTFCGAKRPILYIENPQRSQRIRYIKGDRRAVGGWQRKKEPFTNHTFSLPKDAILYLFTDGMIDQNSYIQNQKLGSQSFFHFIEEIAHLPLHEQKKAFESKLRNFKGNLEQRDDITVVGIRI